MNIDLNRNEQPRQYSQPAQYIHTVPVAPARGSGMFTGFILGAGLIAFGALCVVGGMFALRYHERLEKLEKMETSDRTEARPRGDAAVQAERREHFPSYPVQRDVAAAKPEAAAPAATATVNNPGQPNIYFMMGGQGNYTASATTPAMPAMPVMPAMPPSVMPVLPGQYPGMPAFYQTAQLPAFMQPNMQTDLNQFIMAKYQAEFAEYLKKNGAFQAPAAHGLSAMMPAAPLNAPISSWSTAMPGFVGSEPVAMKREYITTDIAVPEKMTLDLKRRFSRNSVVEDWLREETAAPMPKTGARDEDTSDEGDDAAPKPEVGIDDVLRSLAETTFADKQYDRTARVYAELAARSVNLSLAELMRWAKAAELAGDTDSSLRILDLVLKIDPNNIEVLKEAAQLCVAKERFPLASDYYQRLMQAQPDVREWRMMRAKTLTWSGRGRQAVDLFRELHLDDPEDGELNLMLADLLLSLDEYEESLPLLDALIAADPEDESLLHRKMNALMALQKFREAAIINAQLLGLHPEDTELILKLAVNLVAAQEFAASLPAFNQYLTMKPDDLEVRKQYAEAQMAAQQFSAAAREYKTILSTVGFEDVDNEYLKKLANAYMAAADYKNASGVYRELANVYPVDQEINLALVVSLRMSQQSRAALAAAKAYMARVPYDEKMLAQAGELALEFKDVKDGIRWFRTALKMAPDDYKSRLNLANALMWEMEYESAEAEFKRVLLYSHSNDEARLGLARAQFFQRKYKESFAVYRELAAEDENGVIGTELAFREAVANGQEVEAAKQLRLLQELEPHEITWESDLYQGLLRQHRFPEARAQARVVIDNEPSHRPTRAGMRNMQNYLYTTPVTLRAGLLRKSSKRSDNEQQDRQAKLTYTYFGLHGERSISDFWRVYADADRERWNMRESDVSNASSYRLKLGGIFEGHPNLKFKGDLGYRWFPGSDKNVKGEKRGIDDQWLYNLRGEMVELGGKPFTLGLFSGRREHYDNYNNVYDDLYAYDFGVDGHYRWRKWNFNAELVGSVLTDSNTRLFFHGDAKYRLYETPCMLITLGGNIEYESWNETKETYYSPKDMYKYGIDLDGRYYFCRDPEVWGGTESYMDFGLSIYRDRFSSWGQKFYLGLSHDYSSKLTAFARVDFNRESYYNEVKLLAGVTYKFGGCE